MLRKLRAMGTIDACQLAMVAAHLRLKAQQISVKTAMPRISHAMRVPLSLSRARESDDKPAETRKRRLSKGVVDALGLEPRTR